jgi:predicted enzyme related to lactoylglutathione lyase
MSMERVTGLGGIFFKARQPEQLREWYRRHLGIPVQDWGGVSFEWRQMAAPERKGATVWSIFPGSTDYFEPSSAPFMINYRVRNLDQVLDALRAEGVQVESPIQESEFGRFGWIMDPEGNRIELWEPPAETRD